MSVNRMSAWRPMKDSFYAYARRRSIWLTLAGALRLDRLSAFVSSAESLSIRNFLTSLLADNNRVHCSLNKVTGNALSPYTDSAPVLSDTRKLKPCDRWPSKSLLRRSFSRRSVVFAAAARFSSSANSDTRSTMPTLRALVKTEEKAKVLTCR